MKKMILASILLLSMVQLKASQRTLTSGTQTSSRNDDHESDDESTLSSLSQAYLTARTSPTLQRPTASQGTQTDELTTPGNFLPSAPPEELLQQYSPEYLDEETQTDKKADEQNTLALLNNAGQPADQYTFGVHDKVAAALATALGLKFIVDNPFLNQELVNHEVFCALALISAATCATMGEREDNYFFRKFLPAGVVSGAATVTAFFVKGLDRPLRKHRNVFLIGATVGTALYNVLQWCKAPAATPTPPATQTHALKN